MLLARLSAVATVSLCALVVVAAVTGGWSAAAATTSIDLTTGATDDSAAVEGGAVNGQITADTSNTDVQLFLDLDQDKTVDSGEPTLTVSASEFGTGSSASAPFSGLSVPAGVEDGDVDIVAVQQSAALGAGDTVSPDSTMTTSLDAASDGRVVVDSDSGAGEFDTIQAAVDAATSGDTVVVQEGAAGYSGFSTLSVDNLTVTAASGAAPTVVADSARVEVGANSTVSDLTFDLNGQVIYFGASDNVSFSNNAVNISGSSNYGIRAEASTGVTVTNNTFNQSAAPDGSDFKQAILLSGTSATIDNNTLTGPQKTPTSPVSALGTTIDEEVGFGVYIVTKGGSPAVTITDNAISGFGQGILLNENDEEFGALTIKRNDVSGTVFDHVAFADTTGTDNLGGGGSLNGESTLEVGLVNVTETNSILTTTPAGVDDLLVVDAGLGGEFDTIQTAVDVATNGDTIRVRNATYTESVTIRTSNITLTGVNDPVIVGNGTNSGSQPHAAIHVDGNGPTKETTVEGFIIRNPDGHYGVYAGTGGSNSDVDGFELRENVIRDVATNLNSHDPLAGSVSGLYVRAQYDGLAVENNTVENINTSGDSYQNAVGLGFSSFIGDAAFDSSDTTSEAGNNTTVSNNSITDISGAKSSRTKGISASGEFDDLTIENNTVTNISAPTSDSTVLGITLTENPPTGVDPDNDGTDERIGPRDFDIRNNTVDRITGGTPVGAFVGGYEELGGSHVVADNTINATVSRFNGDQTGFEFADADGVRFRDNDVTASRVALDLDRISTVSGNSLSASTPPDARIDATRDRSDIAAGDVAPVTTRLQTLLSNNDVTTTASATVVNVSLNNPSGRSLNLSVTTTGNVSGATLSVALGNATTGTGNDVRIDEFSETENADGTFTYTVSVEADVESGSVKTYEATVTDVDGNADPDGELPASRSRTLAVATLDSGTTTVSTGSTVVSETSIDIGDATADTTVTVSTVSTLPDTQGQSRSALQSDIDDVDDDDSVVAALDIDPGSSFADTSASLQFTIAKTSIADPEGLLVTRYNGTGYETLPVTVIESDSTDITLETQTPGFSLFAIVETDGSPPTIDDTGRSSNDGGGGGAGISTDLSSSRSVQGVGPYTLRPSGTISEVTVTFDQPTNGMIGASNVGGFPAETPSFDGQVLAAVDIQAPSEAGSSTVRLSVPRSTVDATGVPPSTLRIAHYDQESGSIEMLNTTVVSANSQTVALSAETPGFSVFAVVTQPAQLTATPEPTATPGPASEPTATPEPTSEPTTTAPQVDEGNQGPDPANGTTSGQIPGFTIPITIISLLAAALLALRRR